MSFYYRGYIILYACLIVVCINIAGIILRRVSTYLSSHMETVMFKRILASYIVLLAADILDLFLSASEAAWLFYGTIGYSPGTVSLMINVLNLLDQIKALSLAFFAYFWFMYVEYRLKGWSVWSKRRIWLFRIPIILLILYTLLALLSGRQVILHTTSNISHTTGLYYLGFIIDELYLLYALAHAVIRTIRTPFANKKREYRPIILFVIYPTVGAALKAMMPDIPILAISIIPAIIMVFVDIQNSRIYTDALTGLNNRRRMDEYTEHALKSCGPDRPFRLFIFDLNRFKAINDTYGHIEGDRALVAAAGSFKKAAAGSDLVIGRWGGDEFVAAGFDDISSDELKAKVRMEIDDVQAKTKLPFELSISIGEASCTNPDENISKLVELADADMFADKEEQHRLMDIKNEKTEKKNIGDWWENRRGGRVPTEK